MCAHEIMKQHSQSFQKLPEEITERYERAAKDWAVRKHNQLVEEEESMWNRLALLKDQLEEQEGPSTGASCLKVETCRFAQEDDGGLTAQVSKLTQAAVDKLRQEAAKLPPPVSASVSTRLPAVRQQQKQLKPQFLKPSWLSA